MKIVIRSSVAAVVNQLICLVRSKRLEPRFISENGYSLKNVGVHNNRNKLSLFRAVSLSHRAQCQTMPDTTGTLRRSFRGRLSSFDTFEGSHLRHFFRQVACSFRFETRALTRHSSARYDYETISMTRIAPPSVKRLMNQMKCTA